MSLCFLEEIMEENRINLPGTSWWQGLSSGLKAKQVPQRVWFLSQERGQGEGCFFFPQIFPKESAIKGILIYRGADVVLLTSSASAESAANQEHADQRRVCVFPSSYIFTLGLALSGEDLGLGVSSSLHWS